MIGLAKDCEKTVIPNIRKLESFFLGYNLNWAILESNSRDDTRRKLEAESYRRSNFFLLEEPLDTSPVLSRTTNMAKRRNELLRFVRKQNIPEVEAICVVDLDLNLSMVVNYSQILTTHGSDSVICAHQSPVYYDIYALRFPELNMDYFELTRDEMHMGKNPFRVLKNNLLRHQRSIGQSKSPIVAFSAFGGLAIYPKETLLAGTYQEDNACEHVSINLGLANDLGGFVICPDLATKRVMEHTRFSSGIPYLIFSTLASLPDPLGQHIYRFSKRLGFPNPWR